MVVLNIEKYVVAAVLAYLNFLETLSSVGYVFEKDSYLKIFVRKINVLLPVWIKLYQYLFVFAK